MAALKVMNEVTVKEIVELEEHLGELLSNNNGEVITVQKFGQQVKDRLSHLIWNQIEVEEVNELSGFKDQFFALKEAFSNPRLTLNETDLAATISEDTGIPAGDLQSDSRVGGLHCTPTRGLRGLKPEAAFASESPCSGDEN